MLYLVFAYYLHLLITVFCTQYQHLFNGPLTDLKNCKGTKLFIKTCIWQFKFHVTAKHCCVTTTECGRDDLPHTSAVFGLERSAARLLVHGPFKFVYFGGCGHSAPQCLFSAQTNLQQNKCRV